MIAEPDIDLHFPLATAGDIAVINLESARRQSWSRFWQSPQREGIAEYIVEQEQMTLQFLSDASALDRLDDLVKQLVCVERNRYESRSFKRRSHRPRIDLLRQEDISTQSRLMERSRKLPFVCY